MGFIKKALKLFTHLRRDIIIFMKRKKQIILGSILFLVGSILFWTQIDKINNLETINLLKSFYFIIIILFPLLAFLGYYKHTIKDSDLKKKIWLSLLLIIFVGTSYLLVNKVMESVLLLSKKDSATYEYKYIEKEAVVGIKPFSNKKLAFNFGAQEIEGQTISAQNVYFEKLENGGVIYHQAEALKDLLTIYSKPENISVQNYLKDLKNENYEESQKEDYKKICNVEKISEEKYFFTDNEAVYEYLKTKTNEEYYSFSQDKSFDKYLTDKYGEYVVNVGSFCPLGFYTYFKNENLIVANFSQPIDASEIKVPRNPIDSKLRLND